MCSQGGVVFQTLRRRRNEPAPPLYVRSAGVERDGPPAGANRGPQGDACNPELRPNSGIQEYARRILPLRMADSEFDRVWYGHCPDEAPKPVAS
jgi:hypothetical protein